MRIAVTGASGFIGRAATQALVLAGHEVVAAKRTEGEALQWDLARGFVPKAALSGFGAVLHLAAENIAGGRWNARRKAAIARSRIEGTRRVVEALEHADPRPSTLLCASAVGIYGDTFDRTAREDDDVSGTGFLQTVARDWEHEARQAEALGVRVVRLRFGMVLGRGGGALPRLLPLFRAGLGGKLGGGAQFMAWVHLTDATRAIAFLLETPTCRGPYNVCAPAPVTNAAFTRALAAALHRPAVLAVPAWALRWGLGEMGDALLLGGQRTVPARLEAEGFEFRFPTLDSALKDAVA